MNLTLGIVGLPNVGKSTLFNTLTNISVPAENYPFCTIEPNVGVVPIPDYRLKVLANIVNTKVIIPPVIQFVDIAGLVRGAHKGEGLGNQFLANIREANAIVQIIRVFESNQIIHVENRIDPLADKEIVETEFILKDLEMIDSKIGKVKEEARRDPKMEKFYQLLQNLKEALEKGQLATSLKTEDRDEELLKFRKELFLLTDKPFIYVLNVNDVVFDKEELIENYRKILKLDSFFKLVPLNIKQEFELSSMDKEDKEEMKKELGIESSALEDLIKESYSLLGLMTFFTAGEKEVRGWTVENDSKAPRAAGVIHTDFEKKFIAADVVKFNDFVLAKGWVGSKNMGKVRIEGKEYIFQDGDVAIFKHGA
jgi:hypothetical protein